MCLGAVGTPIYDEVGAEWRKNSSREFRTTSQCSHGLQPKLRLPGWSKDPQPENWAYSGHGLAALWSTWQKWGKTLSEETHPHMRSQRSSPKEKHFRGFGSVVNIIFYMRKHDPRNKIHQKNRKPNTATRWITHIGSIGEEYTSVFNMFKEINEEIKIRVRREYGKQRPRRFFKNPM